MRTLNNYNVSKEKGGGNNMGLPKKIYVVEQEDHGDKYLIADKDLADLGSYSGETVGIYELKSTRKVKVDVTAE